MNEIKYDIIYVRIDEMNDKLLSNNNKIKNEETCILCNLIKNYT